MLFRSGKSQYYKIEEQLQHLSDIHKNSQLAVNPNASLSATILKCSLCRKVDEVNKLEVITSKDYDELRKKSDMRLAFMFTKDIYSVRAKLKYEQSRKVVQRPENQKFLEDDVRIEMPDTIKAPEYSKLNVKRRWRLLEEFLIYLVRHKLEIIIENFNDCSFFTKSNGIEGVEDFFVAVKTSNFERVKTYSRNKPLYLYCFDSVIYNYQTGKTPLH